MDAGLPHGNLINDFVEAIFSRNQRRVAVVRDVLVSAMGEQAMVDAAATIAAFNAYPRMADATGIPLENQKKKATAEMREELGIKILRDNLSVKDYINLSGGMTRGADKNKIFIGHLPLIIAHFGNGFYLGHFGCR